MMRTHSRSGSLCESTNGLPPLNCLLVCRSEQSILTIAVLKAIRSAATRPRDGMNQLNTHECRRRCDRLCLRIDRAESYARVLRPEGILLANSQRVRKLPQIPVVSMGRRNTQLRPTFIENKS